MQTYYRNDKGEGFHPVDISSEDAIAALVQSATKNAVAKVDDIITNFVRSRVESAVENANIQEKVRDHLATTDIGELVDNALSNAVRDYDYDGVIDNALGDIDIDEMVTEKVTDHLGECTIQVSLR
jgi:DNA gyrase/topoisomerase IV subunit B